MKIKILASPQPTCLFFFNGFAMVIYNQGPNTDLMSSSKWLEASRVLPSPATTLLNANAPSQETSHLRGERIPTGPRQQLPEHSIQMCSLEPITSSKAFPLPPPSGLCSLPNWKEKKIKKDSSRIATHKYAQELGTECPFERNPEAKSGWMTYFS